MSDREQERREKAPAWFRKRVGEGTTLPTLERAFMDGHRSRDEEVAALLYKIEAMDVKFTAVTNEKDAKIAKPESQLSNVRDLVKSQEGEIGKADAEIAGLREAVRFYYRLHPMSFVPIAISPFVDRAMKEEP